MTNIKDSSTWIERIISSGYKPQLNDKYRFTDNWYGVSRFNPDEVLVKGEKKIYLSLQGVNATRRLIPTKQNLQYFKDNMVRSISFEVSDKVLWSTLLGELPPDEIINQML